MSLLIVKIEERLGSPQLFSSAIAPGEALNFSAFEDSEVQFESANNPLAGPPRIDVPSGGPVSAQVADSASPGDYNFQFYSKSGRFNHQMLLEVADSGLALIGFNVPDSKKTVLQLHVPQNVRLEVAIENTLPFPQRVVGWLDPEIGSSFELLLPKEARTLPFQVPTEKVGTPLKLVLLVDQIFHDQPRGYLQTGGTRQADIIVDPEG